MDFAENVKSILVISIRMIEALLCLCHFFSFSDDPLEPHNKGRQQSTEQCVYSRQKNSFF